MFRRQIFFLAPILTLLSQPLFADTQSKRASIGGGDGEHGRCYVQVTVDGSADVEISGDTGSLRTISGQPAAWRSFHCTAPLSPSPHEFGIARLASRGSIRVLHDPRRSGGRAVIRIDDPQRGASHYSFELQWRDRPGGWPSPPPPKPGWGGFPGGYTPTGAIANCKEAVAGKLNRNGYRYIFFDRIVPGSGYGNGDWITGGGSGRWGFDTRYFSFHCSVDFASARVRTVDVRERGR